MTKDKSLTPEQLEKAKAAPSAAGLLTLAQENGIALTAEQAATYYAQLHPEAGALSDEELDNVAGGECSSFKCQHCGSTEFTKTVSYIGQYLYVTFYCKNCGKKG